MIIKLEVGPIPDPKLSSCQDLIQPNLKVRSIINPNIIGTIIKYNKRGYISVDVEWAHPEHNKIKIERFSPLYEWELVAEES